MSLSLRAGLAAGLLFAAAALPLAAQDSTRMKEAMTGHDTMAPAMMDHGMMDKGRMAPHGMFAGQHDHTVSGSYSIVEKAGRQTLTLADDFALDGAPDPYIVLSADKMGTGAKTLNLGALKRKQGASTFAIPAGTDLAHYTHALVWCRKYNVTLGAADLALAGAMMHN